MLNDTFFPGSITAVVAELPPPEHPTELRPEDAVSGPWSELTVLVVEDSTIVRERLIRLLTAVSDVRIVGEASTAADAIEKIATLQPDFVTLDLRLERGTGFEVLRAVQTMDPRPSVAVLTNYGDSQSRRECRALGADFVFDKSMELGDLRIALTRLAASARADLPPHPEID